MRVRISDAARADIFQITDHYLSIAPTDVARGFVDALDRAFSFISVSPAAGSPRLRQLCRRPNLRVWPVADYPYLVIYDDARDRTVIIRILHAARDIPASLREPG